MFKDIWIYILRCNQGTNDWISKICSYIEFYLENAYVFVWLFLRSLGVAGVETFPTVWSCEISSASSTSKSVMISTSSPGDLIHPPTLVAKKQERKYSISGLNHY